MPRPRKDTERWSHPLYRVGFCFQRHGNVYTNINNLRSATGLVWHEKNRKLALQILERRVLEYLNPTAKVQEKMLSEAIAEYCAWYFPTVTPGTVRHVKRAFRILMPHNCPLSDTEALRAQLMCGMQEYVATNDTKRGLLKKVHTLFEYCKRQGWMTVNPAQLIIKPKADVLIAKPYSRAEFEAFVSAAYSMNEEFALVLELLGMTAMRIGETLRLRWEDIDEQRMLIHGKGGVKRLFPLTPFPLLKQKLSRLHEISRTPYCIRWRSLPPLQRLLKAACEAALVEQRGFHAIRKMVENEWIDSGRMPPHVAALLAGHSVAIQEKHYRKSPGVAELEKLILS